MPRKELVDYIRKEMKRGANLNAIRRSLLDLGYTYDTIEDALKQARKGKPDILIAGSLIALILIVAIVVSLTLFASDDSAEMDKTDREIYAEALQAENKSRCKEILSNELREECLSKLTPDKKSKEEEKDEGSTLSDRNLYMDAIRLRSPERCEKIDSDALKEKCLDRVG
ncbi:MAG: hypothetical protein ACQEP1_04940 [Nanobdellota archaeon]